MKFQVFLSELSFFIFFRQRRLQGFFLTIANLDGMIVGNCERNYITYLVYKIESFRNEYIFGLVKEKKLQ